MKQKAKKRQHIVTFNHRWSDGVSFNIQKCITNKEEWVRKL